ncbi:MAG: hypothetical protein E7614_08160 [Ruminococcaceae bacterium]|nr:hypothetical protein [Oscillospiraceae bacterium]
MKSKKTFYTEIAFAIGIFILAVGTAFMEKADFGMSMIVVPSYLIHLIVSKYLPFFSFGVSEYLFQAFLLIALSVAMRKVKKSYLLSFITAFVYGVLLDLSIGVMGHISCEGIVLRVIFFLIGMLCCTCGVSLVFHSYLPPEAYEMLVKEVSIKYGFNIGKVKTFYDCCSCLLGIILSFVFFGFGTFVGIGWGTVICAVANGFIISTISKILDNTFVFKDGLNLKNKLN